MEAGYGLVFRQQHIIEVVILTVGFVGGDLNVPGKRDGQVTVGGRLRIVATVDQGFDERWKLAVKKVGKVPFVVGGLTVIQVDADLTHRIGRPDPVDDARSINIHHHRFPAGFDSQVLASISISPPDGPGIPVPARGKSAFGSCLQMGKPI